MINPEIRIILVFLVAFFSSLFVLPKLSRIARVIGLVDHPGEIRKLHKIPRPLVGGIGIVIAATFSSLVFVPITGLRGYFLGLSVLLLVGFLDDFKELGYKEKFAAQVLATVLLMYFSKVSLTSFGNLLGIGNLDIPDIQWLVWGVTTFCVVGVINAVNLIDGLDGLAGGVAFISFLAFAVHASLGGDTTLMLLNLALAGAVLGFLRFNWYPSSLFMGDAGSLCIGFSLAFMSLALTQGSNAHVRPVVALLVLTVPVSDTLTVMGKRILRGESPFKPDQYHLHHIFMRYGMSRVLAVKVILAISVMFSAISFLGPVYKLPEWSLFAVFLGYFFLYILSSFCIIFLMRFSLKLKEKNKEHGDRFTWLRQFISGRTVLFRIFRRSPRYDVELELVCQDRDRNLDFPGNVLNISSDGFMASIPHLDCLLDRVVAKITFPLDDESHSIELPAEHLWFMENEDQYYHGFRFRDFGGDQEQLVFKFLVRFKK